MRTSKAENGRTLCMQCILVVGGPRVCSTAQTATQPPCSGVILSASPQHLWLASTSSSSAESQQESSVRMPYSTSPAANNGHRQWRSWTSAPVGQYDRQLQGQGLRATMDDPRPYTHTQQKNVYVLDAGACSVAVCCLLNNNSARYHVQRQQHNASRSRLELFLQPFSWACFGVHIFYV